MNSNGYSLFVVIWMVLGGCTHRYSNILVASPRINELLLLKDCWMKYLSTDEYM